MQQLLNAPSLPKLLTSAETAAILGLKNANTLAVWRCTHRYPELTHLRIGRMIRYRLDVIEAFLQKHASNYK
jgi:hypothetical protein